MRQSTFKLVLCIAPLTLLLSGCADDATQPKGPEMGSVQAYLDENPEALTEDDGEVSEEEEFTAAEEE